MQLPQYTASMPGGSGQCYSCNALPYCLGAVGSGTSATHLPHCPGAAGSATPTMHCLTAGGHWAVGLLRHTASLPASLPGGSGQWDSCNTLPHCEGAVAVQLL